MSEGFIRKLENRKTKKTLIAMCNLHHIMTSKIILDLYFGFLVCLRYKLIKEIIIVKLKRKDVPKEIKSMAEGIMQLSLQAVQIYTPIVNRIISDTSATQHEVEYLMDYMLSLCHTEEFTNLFKKLCRGIFSRFPDTVYCYAKYYFEEYEDDFESLDSNEKFLRDNKFI